MDLNFFIKNLKNVEKLNRTNTKYVEYSNNFVKYVSRKNSDYDFFQKLGCKSSCVIYIIENFLTKNEVIKLLENINNCIINGNYDIMSIMNYVVNIVSNKPLRYNFLESMTGKCLFKDSIFKKIFNSEYSKIAKLNINNVVIVESIFMKIFSTKKGMNMFIEMINLNKNYGYDESNIAIMEKDIFYKYLTIILIEVFNKKHSFFIKNIHNEETKFILFKFICKLVSNNYIHLINEIRFLSETLHNERDIEYRQIRKKNIKKLIDNFEYFNLVENFYSMCILWLNNLDIKNDETFINNNKELIEDLLHGIYYHNVYNFNFNEPTKYILTLMEKILKRELTTNYSLI